MARFNIAPERSHVWIEARSNVHPIRSTTDGLQGYVELELSPDGGVDLTAPSTGKLSLSVDRLSSGNRMEDREMYKRIDARRFPTIEGVLGQIKQSAEEGHYEVSGDITFRGVSRHHEDLMNIHAVDDQTIQLDGASQFDIRDYGMEPPRMLVLRVEPEVDVRVEILAVRESGT